MSTPVSGASTTVRPTEEKSWLPACPSFRKVVDAVSLIGVSYLAGSALYNASDVQTVAIYMTAILGGALCVTEGIKSYYRSTIYSQAFDHGYLRGKSSGLEQGFNKGLEAAEDFGRCTHFAIKHLGFESLPTKEELEKRFRQIRPGENYKTLNYCYQFLQIFITEEKPDGLMASDIFRELTKIAQDNESALTADQSPKPIT